MTARYDRAPSQALLDLLDGDALLAPLRRAWTVAGLPLDLQLREGDEAHMYCGQTRLLAARRTRTGVRLTAAKRYTEQPCAAALFRAWSSSEAGFVDALGRYLTEVHVDARWVRKEGSVQAAWMAVHDPWVTLDREAVIGRGSKAAREQALEAPAVAEAYTAVDRLASERGWRRPAERKDANELDQLAVDSVGRLVLVELKDTHASEVVSAPLQALRYAWEWHNEVQALLPSLNALLDARRRLGLVPAAAPALDGRLRAAFAWGEGSPSDEVLRRMREVNAIVKGYLPPGIDEVEVWAMQAGRAYRVGLGD